MKQKLSITVEEVIIQSSKDFSLEDKIDFYAINGVNYKNNIYTIDLSKTLLPSKTQDEHAEHRKSARDGFYTPTYPEFHAIISTLEKNKDNIKYQSQIEQLRQFIKRSALEKWLMMLTRIRYNPTGDDIVIHNYKQKDEYSIKSDNFTGPDGYVPNASNAEKPLQSLLDTSENVNEINQIYKWLTDGDAYIYRLNSRPENRDERVAGFYAGSDGADFDCYGYPQYSSASLGVRFASQTRVKK